jgi:hypothetical protein
LRRDWRRYVNGISRGLGLNKEIWGCIGLYGLCMGGVGMRWVKNRSQVAGLVIYDLSSCMEDTYISCSPYSARQIIFCHWSNSNSTGTGYASYFLGYPESAISLARSPFTNIRGELGQPVCLPMTLWLSLISIAGYECHWGGYVIRLQYLALPHVSKCR